MIKVLPRGDTASATVAMLIRAGSIEETLAVVGEALEATSGRTSSVLTASITGLSSLPSLTEGSVTHPLELEVVWLSFEAPTPEGPISAASPSESSEMIK